MKNIGIDIGGTSIKGAVIENGTVTARAKRSTDISRGLDSIRDCLFAVIKDLLPLAGAGAGIGIGSAGDIDPYEGKVLYATGNLPEFTGFEIKKDVENKFNRRVFVVNDAAAAFIGEAYFGAAENCKNAVMLTLGTGRTPRPYGFHHRRTDRSHHLEYLARFLHRTEYFHCTELCCRREVESEESLAYYAVDDVHIRHALFTAIHLLRKRSLFNIRTRAGSL